MANGDSTNLSDLKDETKEQNSDTEEYSSSESDSENDSDTETNSDDSDTVSDVDGNGEGKDKTKTKTKTKKDEVLNYVRPTYDSTDEEDNTPETNIRRFAEVLESRRLKRMRKEQESEFVPLEERYNFPKDPENWKEEDLKELWADAPLRMKKPGWDPVWADEEDWNVIRDEIKAGRNPTIAPFYVPYRKHYPVIPDNHHDIASPKAVIEELDRIEEFLKWVSYVFRDGSSYEGTVWDDLAHGKGVYVAEQGLVRYEGEWLRNDMEGHGVVEVDIPDIEPVPGSNLEAEMRAEGRIIKRDFMTPEDREWLEMDIEDSILMAGGEYEIPFYENEHWVKQFGENPEKGRYRYAGQWKHGRMHGCGVYEVNERTIYGRFYFGELLENEYECDVDISAMHAGIAEVAAAKARMFVNKPDGMVRELRGPYSDPQHPYFYEEEDVWMAPGFINQFYEVPEYWKTYVKEVDQERQMWLNSFYKAPLRLPMPAELEYWWSKDQTREFVLINKEPEPDPEDPSKLIYTDDPLILHTPSGRLINYIDDEEHGIRLFWQPALKDGEDLDLEKVEFLPLGYDEFFGREETVEKETLPKRIIKSVEKTLKPINEKLEKWIEEKKKAAELELKLTEKELELIEAEICLEEVIEDIAEELKESEKEEEKNAEMGLQKEDETLPVNQVEKASADEEDVEEEEEEDDDEDVTQSSFGSVIADQGAANDDQKDKKAGKSPFSSTSLSFSSFSIASMVPSMLQQSFLSWKEKRMLPGTIPPSCNENSSIDSIMVGSVSFHRLHSQNGRLRADSKQLNSHPKRPRISPIHSVSRILCTNSKPSIKEKAPNSSIWLHQTPERDSDNIFSLQIPVFDMDSSNNIT